MSGVLSCDRNKTRFEWPFDTKNKKDRDALVKVLRFCYGETMKVAPHEVCPVVAAVFRLQLNDAQEVVKKARRLCGEGGAGGCGRWCSHAERVCAAYDKCCWLDKALAGLVLTKQNMADHFGVVDNC